MATRDDVFKAIDIADADKLNEILDKEPGLASARSEDGLSAVLFTLYLQKHDLTDILLAHEPQLDLFDLAALGMNDLLAVVLTDPRIDVNMYAGDGFSALHLACFFGQEETVKLLIDKGADVNMMAPNDSHLYPLHSAAAGGQEAIAELLLEAGADPNTIQGGGYTALMSAAHQGYANLVSLLLEKGADLSLVSEDGRRAMDFAKGQPEIEKLLTRH
ncbi:ankyrin repeat domain-containing protein [Emcibacter sp.]|uniref:ankyrin repeat domain-containing protein n=1 Tax=Emcibacter sp. TaxID=1979954 RepID=UPI002AA83DF6|nr:ankyrin repeat domain-containing protein [Emcibacter sp.]